MRLRVIVSLVIAGVLLSAPAESFDPFADLTISKSCRAFLEKRALGDARTQLVLGHLYSALGGGKSTCGWSSTSPYAAYQACTAEAAKHSIGAACLPLVKDSAVVAGSYAEARRLTDSDAWELSMATDPLRCGQEPGSRRYWLEHGFCDVKTHGPEKARGLVLWNHGILGTAVQYRGAPALALRLLHASGWDVLKLNRHNLGEGQDSYRAAEERTLEELKAQRERGYRRLVLAGQSFGGRVALELGSTSDLYAVLAMAPGMEATVGNTRTQAPTDERLRRAKAERIVVIFPGEDLLFGNVDRASTAGPILAKLARPYFMVDEKGGLKGHGGGTGGNFALRYGRCLDEFLSAPTATPGRFECAAGGGWPVARQLVPPLPPYLRVVPADALPGDARELAGLWYGLLGESIVAWALVDTGKPAPGMYYAWASSGTSRGGGIYDAVVSGAEVQATLPNQAVLTVRRRDARALALTWTPAPQPTNFGIVAPRVEPLHGDLMPAEPR